MVRLWQFLIIIEKQGGLKRYNKGSIVRLYLFETRLRKISYILKSKRLFSSLLFDQVLAATEHHPILSIGFRTVTDIGANRGQFALAAKKWSPDAKVVAFEPLPTAAFKFRKLFHQDEDIILHQVAIGPINGETTLHVSASDDSSSLLPISQLQETLFPGTQEVGRMTVKIGRLSDYVTAEDIIAPALLKIDVQGYELEALRGCEDLLSCFQYVYTECSFRELYSGQALAYEVIDWLWEKGFQFNGIFNVVNDKNGHSVQADFLFYNYSNEHTCLIKNL